MNPCNKCGQVKNLADFYTRHRPVEYTSKICKACVKAKQLDYYKASRDTRVVKMREYRAHNLDKLRLYDRKRYQEDKERRLAYVRSWRKNNPQKVKDCIRHWAESNKARKYQIGAERRARKLNAAPPWLTEDHKNQIRLMYENCPKGYHVDHIIPLKGSNVCGLHVPWNSQYLTAEENLRKGIKYDVKGAKVA